MSEIVERNGTGYEIEYGPGCDDCYGLGATFSHEPSCSSDFCAGNADEHSCGGAWLPCDVCGSMRPLAAKRERRERAEQLLTDLTPGGPEYANPARCFDYVRDELLRRQALTVQLERERDEVSRHHVSCTMTVVEREADLRAKLDEARAWSGLWKFAAKRIRLRERTLDRITDTMERERDAARRWSALWKRIAASKRRVVKRQLGDLMNVSLERQIAKRERDAARAWSAAWKAAAHNHRQSAHRLIEEQVDVRLERITAERERDEARAEIADANQRAYNAESVLWHARKDAASHSERAEAALAAAVGVKRQLEEARAQVAALREAVEYVVDGLEHQSMIDVEAANYLRAALGNAPAAHTCREPALRDDLARLVAEYTRDGRCASCGDDVGACGCGVGRVRAALAGGADGEPA